MGWGGGAVVGLSGKQPSRKQTVETTRVPPGAQKWHFEILSGTQTKELCLAEVFGVQITA